VRKVNKTLVPIDFSEESATALKYALSLAKETRSEVVALHVIEKTDDSDFFMSSVAMLEGSPFPVSEFPAIPVDVLLGERSLDLWNFIGRTVEANNRVKITKRMKMSSFLKAITATIQEEDVDLVVLELRKRSFPDLGALKLIKLIRSLPCPVLLDPPLARPL
jgi:Universal stress protein family